MNDLSPIERDQVTPASHATIFKALAAAQKQMGPALKDAENAFFKKGDGKGTPYATLQSVIEACLPALNSNGIAVYQPLVEIDGQRYVKTILAHESGETVEGIVPLIVGKNDMQGLGSAITYGRRYGLMSMAGIAPDDDDGNAAAKAAPLVEDRNQQRPTAPKKEAPKSEKHDRDPGAIAAGLIAGIAKVASIADLDAANTDGTKFAAAWQWLEDNHPEEAAGVKKAFDARRNALTDEIPF
ncbi:ERF family protein [Paenirhodobacter populi]|uniref:ERF family protein n=1 Tax=Paenirhodobacter populi TaxID=2306993 RepID=UPI000FE3A424|nr:ERF family protein [Sinirhodobacter populi]RWR09777.1 hypothetical protein D2T32_05395 [Sinirhodobacter populi]